jgi:hypothetical protein
MLADDPMTLACHSPSAVVEIALTEALGHPFVPPAEH